MRDNEMGQWKQKDIAFINKALDLFAMKFKLQIQTKKLQMKVQENVLCR